MPFDGLGVFSPKTPEYPAVPGTVIEATKRNTLDADFAAGLTNCMTRDGQGAATGPQNFGGQSLNNANNGNFSGALTVGTLTVNGATITATSAAASFSTVSATGLIQSLTVVKVGAGAAGEKNVTFHNAARQVHFYLNDASSFGLYDVTGGATRWNTDTSGNFTATGNVSAFSDERVKYSWKKMPLGFIYELSKVRSGTYSRKDKPLRQVGVSAQSLREVMPEAVIEDADGMLSVAYGNAALVACVELAKEVLLLKKRLAKLEAP